MPTHPLRLALAALLFSGACAHAAPVDFNGRGVHRFASASGCPLGASLAPADCNRVSLDRPKAHATLDTAAHTILFDSEVAPGDEVLVGDVLLQGSGVSEDGQRVPLSLQVLLRREGEEWDLDIYVHAPVRGKFTGVTMDPYVISVVEDKARRVIYTPGQARAMFADTGMARRLARAVVAVRPTNPATPSAGDITIALGVGKLSKSVARAGFTSTATGSPGALGQALSHGTWAVELEALSSHIPLWVVQRELFLFGLEDQAILRPLQREGFNKRDKLTFGARDGKGYVRFNGQQAAFDNAPAAGRAFMQESFMGLILTWRRQMATPIVAGAPAVRPHG